MEAKPGGTFVTDAGEIRRLAPEFLRISYEIGLNEPSTIVMLNRVAEQLGPDDLGTPGSGYVEKLRTVAQYLGSRGFLKRQSADWGMFSVTREGIDEVEGNKPDAGSTFQFFGNVQGSVIGTHNTAELTNTFDFRAIEQRIEEEGGEDKEGLKRALAQVQRLLERGDYLDRGALSQFSGVMERHSWFTGSVMQALLGFATQAVG